MRRIIEKMIMCLLVIIFAVPLASSAQSISSGIDVIIKTANPNPSPGEEVRLYLESGYVDLDSAYIKWYEDGKPLKEGYGKKRITVTAPAQDSEMKISVRVSGAQGVATSSITISTYSVDIVPEAYNVYVPPFYKGRRIPTLESSVKFVALPSGAFSAKNSVYTWSRNGSNLSSGRGEDYYIYHANFIDGDVGINLKVRDIESGKNATASAQVKLREPKIIFYKTDNGYPDMSRGYGSGGELYVGETGFEKIFVSPYFFMTGNDFKNLEFEWNIATGENISYKVNPYDIDIIKSGNGTAMKIDLSVTSSGAFFQEAKAFLTIK